MSEYDSSPFVSTGRLPPAERAEALVDEAYARFRNVDDGIVSDVYPALARVDPELFAVCVAAVDGRIHAIGDAEVEFAIMSVAKPFTFALVCDAIGADEVRRRVGVNATGLAFNSLEAVQRGEGGRTNPLVNPGAIATASLRSRRDTGATVALRPGRSLPLRRPPAPPRGRGVRVGNGDQRAKPRARSPPRGAWRDRLRPWRGGRPLHAAELPARDRP